MMRQPRISLERFTERLLDHLQERWVQVPDLIGEVLGVVTGHKLHGQTGCTAIGGSWKISQKMKHEVSDWTKGEELK